MLRPVLDGVLRGLRHGLMLGALRGVSLVLCMGMIASASDGFADPVVPATGASDSAASDPVVSNAAASNTNPLAQPPAGDLVDKILDRVEEVLQDDPAQQPDDPDGPNGVAPKLPEVPRPPSEHETHDTAAGVLLEEMLQKMVVGLARLPSYSITANSEWISRRPLDSRSGKVQISLLVKPIQAVARPALPGAGGALPNAGALPNGGALRGDAAQVGNGQVGNGPVLSNPAIDPAITTDGSLPVVPWRAVSLSANTDPDRNAELVVVSDGQQITSLFTERSLYSQRPVEHQPDELLADGLVLQTLSGSGIDLLLRDNLAAYVDQQGGQVRDLGEVRRDGSLQRGFGLMLAGKETELWLESVEIPIVRRVVERSTTRIGDDQLHLQEHAADLVWKLNAAAGSPTGNRFAIQLPPGAQRVNDLYAALNGSDHTQLVGQPAPEVRLSSFDAANGTIEESPTVAVASPDQITVLAFWATWSAPSVDEMPTLSAVVRDFSNRGVRFLAVNAGEEAADLQAFVTEYKPRSQIVVDTDSSALRAFGIEELPGVVVIDRRGIVMQILHGEPAEIAKQLRELLNSVQTGR